jgi:hypothetical protein
VHIDWDGGHGPVTGPINAAGATLAAAWLGHVAHLPPELAAATAGLGMAGTAVAGVRRHFPPLTLGLHAAAWLGAGAWSVWAVADSPWHATTLGAIVAGAVGLGTALVGAHKAGDRKAVQQAAAAEQVERASMDHLLRKVADEWDDRLARVCTSSTVKVVAVEHWDSGGGMTLGGECLGGTKWKDIKNYEDALAADAKLPEGCGVEVKAGTHRGAILIDVSTANAFLQDCPYPQAYTRRSINDPVSYGPHRDGSPTQIVKRQATGLISARKGTGKTNLLNVDIANECQMDDVLQWVIDLNGGGLALAWLHAWHEAGRPGKPPVDWVADTPAKVLAMAKALLRIAKARKPGYKKREIAANDDKLPVGPDVPAISLKADEIAEIYSPRARQDPVLKEAGDILVQVVELARAVALVQMFAALRVTQDVISEPQILKQSTLKIGMQSDESELAYLCGWGDRVSPEDIPYPGCGVVKIAETPARPFKAYRLQPQQIRDVVVATADWRPELDELSRQAAGDAYERRWDGTDHLFGAGEPPLPSIAEPAPGAAAQPAVGGITADWGSTSAPAATDTQALLDQADAAREQLRRDAAAAVNRDPDLDRRFREVIEGAGGIWKPSADQSKPSGLAMPTPGITGDSRWMHVFSIVHRAGRTGVSPDAIIEAFRGVFPAQQAPSRSAVTGWLKQEPQIVQPGGPRTSYVHIEHLERP